jgi:hypothetical protein
MKITNDLGFLFWEFPTVYIAQKLRLAKYLGCNVVVWGVILMLQGATTNFGALFALRFLLGMSRGGGSVVSFAVNLLKVIFLL